MDCLSASQLRPSGELAASPVRASRFLTADDTGRLTRFYLGFDFEARRSRFGEAVCDDAIIDYCDAIEWRRSILIARAGAVDLKAVLEIHPLSQQWDCAELIAACPDDDDRIHCFAQLLQIAAFAAGQRGCRSFLVPLDDTSREILPLLQGMGRVRLATTQACVDLEGYAISRQRVRGAAMPWPLPVGIGIEANMQFG
jgi:hypothetical protein